MKSTNLNEIYLQERPHLLSDMSIDAGCPTINQLLEVSLLQLVYRDILLCACS